MPMFKPILAACLGAALFVHPQPGRALGSWSPLDGYQAELKRQCPEEQLFRLDVQGLRGALQAFQATLPREIQAEIDDTRAADCSAAHNAYAGACENSAAIDAITRNGRLTEAAVFICTAYRGCSEPSDCPAAPR